MESDGRDGATPSTSTPLQDKLAFLFDTVRRPDGRKYSGSQLAEGCAFSREYVSLMLNGRRTNPTMDSIQKMAAFFDVPVAFFFDTEEGREVTAQLALLAGLRDAGVDAAALRALTEMTPADREAVLEAIRRGPGAWQQPTTRAAEPATAPSAARQPGDQPVIRPAFSNAEPPPPPVR